MTAGANIIFINDENKILLQLREDKKEIRHPNIWCTLGGHLEGDEEPEACLIREMKEELDLDLKETDFEQFAAITLDGVDESIFWMRFNEDEETLNKKLTE